MSGLRMVRFGVLLAVAVVGCGLMRGQEAAPAKAQAFETISIKPNNSGGQGGSWGMTGRTFRGKNVTMAILLMQVYFPAGSWSMDRLKGLPSWATDEHYDIQATVDDATMESWKDLNPREQLVKATPMLLEMLTERCKLAAHKVPGEVQGYALVVGKNGPKMKEAVPGEAVPDHAMKMGGDWMMVPTFGEPNGRGRPILSTAYFQISMPELAEYMGRGPAPMVDQTGLKGKYDFQLPRRDMNPQEGTDGANGAPPAANDPVHLWDWSAIGLEMKPIKVPMESVVVDHIEKPSVN